MAHGESYGEFKEKFEAKRTTDDCYTPPMVYEAVRRWAVAEYGLEGARVVRPFYPGGDYEAEEYPEGCVVIDNPPFSMLSAIVGFYRDHGVRFFLFAPTLTCMGVRRCSKVICGAQVTYDNGAKVNTSFVTDLDAAEARSAPALRRMVDEADEATRAGTTARLPKYDYPWELVTAPMLAKYAKYGIDYRVAPGECEFTRALDAQRAVGKAVFGSGYLVSERAALVGVDGARFELSERERRIVRSLG